MAGKGRSRGETSGFDASRAPADASAKESGTPTRAQPRQRLQRHPDLKPSHPGVFLREIVVPATGRSKTEIAELLGVSRQTLYDLLSERGAVTPQIALRLGKLFGDGPEAWLNMQTAHDLWVTRRALADAIEAIPTLPPAAA